MAETEQADIKEPVPLMPLAEFLEGVPPGSAVQVDKLTVPRAYQGGGFAGHRFAAPEIQLHCGSDSCNRTLFFRRVGDIPPDLPEGK